MIAIFNHEDQVNDAVFNKKADLIVTGSKDKTAKIWALYKKATLEQILLRKLFILYFQFLAMTSSKEIKKPSRELQEIEILINEIATTFNLDEQELLEIWQLIDEKVQNSLRYSLKKFWQKKFTNIKKPDK